MVIVYSSASIWAYIISVIQNNFYSHIRQNMSVDSKSLDLIYI